MRMCDGRTRLGAGVPPSTIAIKLPQLPANSVQSVSTLSRRAAISAGMSDLPVSFS